MKGKRAWFFRPSFLSINLYEIANFQQSTEEAIDCLLWEQRLLHQSNISVACTNEIIQTSNFYGVSNKYTFPILYYRLFVAKFLNINIEFFEFELRAFIPFFFFFLKDEYCFSVEHSVLRSDVLQAIVRKRSATWVLFDTVMSCKIRRLLWRIWERVFTITFSWHLDKTTIRCIGAGMNENHREPSIKKWYL